MNDVAKTTQFPQIHQAYVAGQPVLAEWTTNASFYALYPTSYITFANMFLRRWLGWYDGYVHGVHNTTGGLLSTRIGTTLVKRLTQQVMGGGLLYEVTEDNEDGNEALDFISNKWAGEVDLSNTVQQAIEFAGAGGTSVLKLNSNNRDVWVEALRADSFYLNITPKGDVRRARFLINKYTRTVPGTNQEQNFYIVEERYYGKNSLGEEKPYVVYKVYRLGGQATSPDMTQFGRGLNFSEIPKDVGKTIRDEYGAIELDKPQLLPFMDLGCYPVKWTKFISNIPQLQYGESILAQIQTYLFMYDYMYSAFNTDMYLGRGRVYVPKRLQDPRKKGGQNYNTGLDSFLYTQVEGTTSEYNKLIEAMQFELRSNDWVTNRNNLLESIATALGISPSTIASYLNDTSARTAREISSEESSTTLLVEAKRELIKMPINKMIKTILQFFGFADKVKVRFSKAGQTNETLLIENTTKKLQAGLISRYTAIKEINPDLNEEQLKEEYEEILKDEREKVKQQQSDLFGNLNYDDDVGDFVDEEEDTVSQEGTPELASTDDRGSADGNKADNPQ